MIDINSLSPEARVKFELQQKRRERRRIASKFDINDYRAWNASPLYTFNTIPNEDEFDDVVRSLYPSRDAQLNKIFSILVTKQAFDDLVTLYPTCRDEDGCLEFSVVDHSKPYGYIACLDGTTAEVFYPLGRIAWLYGHRVYSDFMLEPELRFIRPYINLIDVAQYTMHVN